MIDSWNANGMNWENPDPGNADYWNAVLLAIQERDFFYSSFRAQPLFTAGTHLKQSDLENIRDRIAELAPAYISEGPFVHTANNQWEVPGIDCREILKTPAAGMQLCELADFLKACRNVLDSMTRIRTDGEGTASEIWYSSNGITSDNYAAAVADMQAAEETSAGIVPIQTWQLSRRMTENWYCAWISTAHVWNLPKGKTRKLLALSENSVNYSDALSAQGPGTAAITYHEPDGRIQTVDENWNILTDTADFIHLGTLAPNVPLHEGPTHPEALPNLPEYDGTHTDYFFGSTAARSYFYDFNVDGGFLFRS